MMRFPETRDVLSQVKNFKLYKENEGKCFSREETDLHDVVLRYLMEYILIVFIAEGDNFREDMVKSCAENYKKEEEYIQSTIKNILSNKDELPTRYLNFRENRHNIAHKKQATFLTWEEFTNIKLQEFPNEEFNIAGIGELLLKRVYEELISRLK